MFALRVALLAGVLSVGVTTRLAHAHETDQFTPPPRRSFAELGPVFTRDFHERIAAAIADTNARIQRAARSRSGLETLRSPDYIAKAVCAQFGVAGFYIDEVNRFVHAADVKAQYPGLITAHRAEPCIYDEALLPVDPRKFYLLWRGSVFVINGVYLSSDKIGHFVHHGHNYYVAYRRALRAGRSERAARYQAALDVGVGGHLFFSEWRALGVLTSGVVSNADLAANYIGMLFFINLTQEVQLQGQRQPPILRLENGYWRFSPYVNPDSDFLTRFFSPHFDEALNPNWYDPLTARVLTGVIGKRCAHLRLLYVDENGVPRPGSYFRNLREQLHSYYGEPYGHTPMDEAHLCSIANACFECAAAQANTTAAELRSAVEQGDHQTVAALLAAGADPDLPAEAGERVPVVLRDWTILHVAARAGNESVVGELLAAGANPRATTVRGATPLHAASNAEVVDQLSSAGAPVDAQDALGRTPLHWACRAGRRNVAARLLEVGADVAAADCDGETALHLAARRGDAKLAAVLLRHNAGPSVRALYETTPLHLAARQGQVGVVRLLVSAGADAGASDIFGCTPLHDAASTGHTEIVRVLLGVGAPPYARDALGNTPVQAAAQGGYTRVVHEIEQAVAVRRRDTNYGADEPSAGDRPQVPLTMPAADTDR